jgi:hypothetical protein
MVSFNGPGKVEARFNWAVPILKDKNEEIIGEKGWLACHLLRPRFDDGQI